LSRSAAHRPTWISTVEILTLVAAGRGIAIVPAAVATQQPRPHIVYVLVTDADPAVVSLARRPGSTNPALELFVHSAREVAARRKPGAAQPRLADC
jgi:DNA-binding transcriptional LysR family regulator